MCAQRAISIRFGLQYPFGKAEIYFAICSLKAEYSDRTSFNSLKKGIKYTVIIGVERIQAVGRKYGGEAEMKKTLVIFDVLAVVMVVFFWTIEFM